jgi:hypothetical protein
MSATIEDTRSIRSAAEALDAEIGAAATAQRRAAYLPLAIFAASALPR